MQPLQLRYFSYEKPQERFVSRAIAFAGAEREFIGDICWIEGVEIEEFHAGLFGAWLNFDESEPQRFGFRRKKENYGILYSLSPSNVVAAREMEEGEIYRFLSHQNGYTSDFEGKLKDFLINLLLRRVGQVQTAQANN